MVVVIRLKAGTAILQIRKLPRANLWYHFDLDMTSNINTSYDMTWLRVLIGILEPKC